MVVGDPPRLRTCLKSSSCRCGWFRDNGATEVGRGGAGLKIGSGLGHTTQKGIRLCGRRNDPPFGIGVRGLGSNVRGGLVGLLCCVCLLGANNTTSAAHNHLFVQVHVHVYGLLVQCDAAFLFLAVCTTRPA